jgi:ubiquitin carboxyl-terminal hydrolase 22/27/51
VDCHRIPAPVGMYNLGNTCFMSAILHCLIHCVPLQKYFLSYVGHHHLACNIYRTMSVKPATTNLRDSPAKTKAKLKTVCLACELDKLFLRYMGSAKGIDLLSIVDTSASRVTTSTTVVEADVANTKKDRVVIQGNPLLTAEMLAASWKCGGMNHLAGYEQRDAHEFLHGFLETLGQHMRQYRDRVRMSIHAIQTSKPFVNAEHKTNGGKSFFIRHCCTLLCFQLMHLLLKSR